MRIYWINEFGKGNLGMMARPRGNEWLENEVLKLKLQEVDIVVSLLERHEEKELEITGEQGLCEKHNIEFIHFPIQDRGVPDNFKAFLNLVSTLDQRIKEDKRIAIHSGMGIGRTSLVSAGVLLKNGESAENVFKLLSEKRTLNVPDTVEQIDWIKDLEGSIK